MKNINELWSEDYFPASILMYILFYIFFRLCIYINFWLGGPKFRLGGKFMSRR